MLDSVSHWLTLLQQGAPGESAGVWKDYFLQVAKVAVPQLGTMPRGVADERNAAIEGLAEFCSVCEQGRLPDIEGRDELWRVLTVVAALKARDRITDMLAELHCGNEPAIAAVVTEATVSEPTPSFILALLDELQYLLKVLRQEDVTLGLIAMRKAAGFSNEEVALELSVSITTIERKRLRINIVWAQSLE